MKISGRRVVTGFNKDGRSCIKWDTVIDPVRLRPGFENIPMWATRKLPAETTEEDPNTWELGTSLAGGSVFRFGRYEPGNVRWASRSEQARNQRRGPRGPYRKRSLKAERGQSFTATT